MTELRAGPLTAEIDLDPCADEHQPGCGCVNPEQVAAPVPSYLARLADTPSDQGGEKEETEAAISSFKQAMAGIAEPIPEDPKDSLKGDALAQLERDERMAKAVMSQLATSPTPSPSGVGEALERLGVLRDQARHGTPVSDPNEWEADELDEIIQSLADHARLSQPQGEDRVHSPAAHTQPGSADRWADLERLALEATPGPWEEEGEVVHYKGSVRPSVNVYAAAGRIVGSIDYWLEGGHENHTFIAAANPAAVLALIAAARANSVGMEPEGRNEPKDAQPPAGEAGELVERLMSIQNYSRLYTREHKDIQQAAALISSLLSQAEKDREDRSALVETAFIAGATSVHDYWTENPGEAPRGDPEFDEAAHDYAASVVDAQRLQSRQHGEDGA